MALDDTSMLALPYTRRRELLAGLGLAGPAVRMPASTTSLREVVEAGLVDLNP